MIHYVKQRIISTRFIAVVGVVRLIRYWSLEMGHPKFENRGVVNTNTDKLARVAEIRKSFTYREVGMPLPYGDFEFLLDELEAALWERDAAIAAATERCAKIGREKLRLMVRHPREVGFDNMSDWPDEIAAAIRAGSKP